MRALAMLSFWQIKNAVLLVLRDRRRLALFLCLAALMVGIRLSVRWHRIVSLFVSIYAAQVLRPWLVQIETGVFVCLVLLAAAEFDRACVLAVLEFSPADTDYLFPAPVGRRILLAAKLPATLSYVAMITMAMCMGFSIIWDPLALVIHLPRYAGLHAVAAVALCMGGYSNLAIGVELFCIGKVGMIVRRALLAASAGALVWFGYGFWEDGVAGLVLAAHNPVIEGLYYPCKLCADAAMNPFFGRPNGVQVELLAVFYAVSFGILFLRGANYYEAAMAASELVRSRKVEAGGVSVAASSTPPRTSGRLFTLPTFGRGANAILWAHLSAAAKQPFINFILPFFGGLFLVIVTSFFPESFRDRILTLACIEFFFLVPTAVSQVSFQQSVRRHSIMRVLPISPWRIVLAEVLPRALMISLCFWGVCSGLLAAHRPGAAVYVPLLLVVMPLEIICMDLRMYAVVLSFPGLGDKFQALQAGALAFLLMGPMLAVQAVPAIVAKNQGGSDALAMGCLILSCFAACCLMFSFVTRIYTSFQPSMESPKRRSFRLEGGLPKLDEALALAFVFPMLAHYTHLWSRLPANVAFVPEVLVGSYLFAVAPAALLVWARGVSWRDAFLVRPISPLKTTGSILIGLGILPWTLLLRGAQDAVWPLNAHISRQLISPEIAELIQHPMAIAFVIAFGAAVAREPLYRGIVQSALLRRFPERYAIVVGAIVYGLAQLDLHGLSGQVLFALAAGWMVARTGSIVPAFIAQMVYTGAISEYYVWLVQSQGAERFYWMVGHDQGIHVVPLPMILATATLMLAVGHTLIRSSASTTAVKNIPASAT